MRRGNDIRVIANFLLNLKVQYFLKSANVWQCYERNVGLFWLTKCTCPYSVVGIVTGKLLSKLLFRKFNSLMTSSTVIQYSFFGNYVSLNCKDFWTWENRQAIILKTMSLRNCWSQPNFICHGNVFWNVNFMSKFQAVSEKLAKIPWGYFLTRPVKWSRYVKYYCRLTCCCT